MNYQLEIAEKIARKAHEGQFRNDGVTPYITHPEAVASAFTDEIAQSIAWLHDVIEDTDITAEDLLREGIDKTIVDAVVALTRRKTQTYPDYILTVRSNTYARLVKVADIGHNSQTLAGKNIEDKYLLALYVLKTTKEEGI